MIEKLKQFLGLISIFFKKEIITMEVINELISINSLYLIKKFEVQGFPVLVSHSPLFARYFPLFQVNRFCVFQILLIL